MTIASRPIFPIRPCAGGSLPGCYLNAPSRTDYRLSTGLPVAGCLAVGQRKLAIESRSDSESLG